MDVVHYVVLGRGNGGWSTETAAAYIQNVSCSAGPNKKTRRLMMNRLQQEQLLLCVSNINTTSRTCSVHP